MQVMSPFTKVIVRQGHPQTPPPDPTPLPNWLKDYM